MRSSAGTAQPRRDSGPDCPGRADGGSPVDSSQEHLEILETEVAPSLEETLRIAEKGFADGGTDYLLVLQTTSQYIDAKTQLLDQKAAMRRARAELERAVGRRLSDAPEELPAPLPPVDLVPTPVEERE